MIKVVKLILICQIKDEKIPQLIPLYWILSSILVILLIIIYLKVYGNFNNVIIKSKNNGFNYINLKWYW